MVAAIEPARQRGDFFVPTCIAAARASGASPHRHHEGAHRDVPRENDDAALDVAVWIFCVQAECAVVA